MTSLSQVVIRLVPAGRTGPLFLDTYNDVIESTGNSPCPGWSYMDVDILLGQTGVPSDMKPHIIIIRLRGLMFKL